MMQQSGIYQITNTVSKKRYIGSAVNIQKRWNGHKSKLRNGNHDNSYIQKSWNKHNECNFKFEVLATCPKEYLIKMEQWFIDKLNPEYNICKVAGSPLGYRHTESSIKKMSAAVIGRKLSEETKQKIIIKNKKPIYQYNREGWFIKKHNSLKEAAEEIGVSRWLVSAAANGRQKSVTKDGVQFRFFYCNKIQEVKVRERCVVIYSENVIIGVYGSITDCANKLRLDASCIVKHLKNSKTNLTIKGFTAKEITKEEYKNLTTNK